MHKLLKTVMDQYHSLSDKNFIWFPFTVLRPKPNELIGLNKLILMIFCFGLYGSILWPLKQWLGDSEFTLNGWAVFALKSLGFFSVWFTVVTRPLWNQRARSLQSQ